MRSSQVEARHYEQNSGLIPILTIEEFQKLTGSKFDGTVRRMISPVVAQYILDHHNPNNRPMIRRKVAQWAKMMRDGHFANTGEALIFNDHGTITSAQHRLQASVETGCTFESDLRFGVPWENYTKTDTGLARSAANALHIAGATRSQQVAQAVRLLILYQRGLPDSVRDMVTNDEIVQRYRDWSDLDDVADLLAARRFPRHIRSAPLLVTAFLAQRQNLPDLFDEWLSILETGATNNTGHPARLLRERLVHGLTQATGSRELLVERFAVTIKSWNLLVAHKRTRILRWSEREGFPTVEGVRL